MPVLLLGSGSPRRHRIIGELGIPFVIESPVVREAHHAGDAARTVIDNALAKHEWCAGRYPRSWVLTADTVVEFEGVCIGKPADEEQAADFLRRFSGNAQQVFTAVAISAPGGAPELRVEASSLRFKRLNEVEIREYLRLAAPYDRAGAYDVDTHGGRIIEGFRGSYTNIMGLPAESVADCLVALGYPLPASGRAAIAGLRSGFPRGVG